MRWLSIRIVLHGLLKKIHIKNNVPDLLLCFSHWKNWDNNNYKPKTKTLRHNLELWRKTKTKVDSFQLFSPWKLKALQLCLVVFGKQKREVKCKWIKFAVKDPSSIIPGATLTSRIILSSSLALLWWWPCSRKHNSFHSILHLRTWRRFNFIYSVSSNYLTLLFKMSFVKGPSVIRHFISTENMSIIVYTIPTHRTCFEFKS